MLVKENFFLTMTETNTIKILKIYPETSHVNQEFLIMITYYIALKRSLKMLFNGNIFENVDEYM